jgi:hypothetical protein
MADQGRSNPGTCFWIASPSVRNDVAETMTQAEKQKVYIVVGSRILKNSDNPFAMVVLLQLAALETKPDDKQRLMTKLEFFRNLNKHGWDIEKIFKIKLKVQMQVP